MVAGTADEIVPFEEVEVWTQSLPSVDFHPIDGAGHFFVDHMQEMKQALL